MCCRRRVILQVLVQGPTSCVMSDPSLHPGCLAALCSDVTTRPLLAPLLGGISAWAQKTHYYIFRPTHFSGANPHSNRTCFLYFYKRLFL